tara:strand:+ start:1872 stop:3527 length:1656 start_codon:yes stop_codon:yes gene_type:complete
MRQLGMPVKPTRPVVLKGLGDAGLNTQAEDSTLGPQWLTEANNVVYDLEGRMGPRKGSKQVGKILASPVKSLGEFVKSDRTREYYGGSGATIVKLDTSTTPHGLTTQSFAGSPQTITDSNWQWINFNDQFWGVQSGHMPINYSGSAWTDIDDLGSYQAPAGVTTFDPSCALGEFGRIWYGGVTEDKGTVFYSDNLIGQKLQGGASGSIDLKTVWGNDEIIALGALEDKLVVFGKQNIVIFKSASVPTSISLDEIIIGTGLAGRDNLVYVGTELLFLSFEGLTALSRLTQQDGKAPVETVSIAVRNDLSRIISTADLSQVKSCYHQTDGFVVTFIPSSNIAYYFDFSRGVKTVPRITTWTFTSNPYTAVSTLDGKLYMGTSTSVAEYTGYNDIVLSNVTGSFGNESACETAGHTFQGGVCYSTVKSDYNWQFQSTWLDLGDQVFSKIIKSGLMIITGGQNSAATITIAKDYEEDSTYSKTFTLVSDAITFLYGSSSSLYGKAKYAPIAGPREYKVPLARTGKNIRIKMVVEVNGHHSSLINTTLLTKQGKIR